MFCVSYLFGFIVRFVHIFSKKAIEAFIIKIVGNGMQSFNKEKASNITIANLLFKSTITFCYVTACRNSCTSRAKSNFVARVYKCIPAKGGGILEIVNSDVSTSANKS